MQTFSPPALLIKNADKRMLKGFSNLMAGRAYDPLEILVIFSVRENMSLTNNSKLILGVNDLLHVSLHHLSKGGVFVIAKRRLYFQSSRAKERVHRMQTSCGSHNFSAKYPN